MRYLVNPVTGDLKEESSIPPATAEDADKFLRGDGTWAEVDLSEFSGTDGSDDGTKGMVPPPSAGDKNKTLQGSGEWGHKLEFDAVIQNGSYGYIDSQGNFVSFKSQADIDAAVSAAMVGTATAADVLAGQTFTNASSSGLTGTLPDRKTNSIIVPKWGTSAGSNVPATQIATRNPRIDFGNSSTYGSAEMVEIAMPAGCYAWSYGNSSCCIPTETKTVTASRSAQTVTPTGYNTAGQYVKFLKSVTINKFPDATGTYATSTRGTAVDMGASNNYRYVNTNGVSNTNSGTYTIGTASTGATIDMGATNTYRYVNAANVYNRGKAAVTLTVIKTDGWGYNGSKTETITQNYVNSYKTLIIIVLACSPSMSNTANLPCSCSGSSVSMIIDRGVTASNTSGILRAYSTSSFATNGTITVSGGHSNGGGLLYALCGLSK